MAENKTQRTDADVDAFLEGVEHDTRRRDAQRVCHLLREVTGEEPAMWGDAIVGFGTYEYRYASGREGTWPRLGLSPRKQSLTIYVMDGFDDKADLLERLGPHRTSVSCLYVTRRERIDEGVLVDLLRRSWERPAMGEVDG